jgi:hypothetical protein
MEKIEKKSVRDIALQTKAAVKPLTALTKIVEPGVGATAEFSLRVSTAVLGRVHLKHPATGEEMLVLERKCSAEIKDNGELKTILNCQPLGGASVLKNPQALAVLIDGFNYDTEKSKKEGDFRIQARPADWPRIRDFCVENFSNPALGAVEVGIQRELQEELQEALSIDVNPAAYKSRNTGIVIQQEAAQSERLGVSGAPTCRVFNVHDVEITDEALIRALLHSSASVSNEYLITAAHEKAAASPKHQAKVTAMLTLPRAEVEAAFAQANDASQSVKLRGYKLIATVGASLKAGA